MLNGKQLHQLQGAFCAKVSAAECVKPVSGYLRGCLTFKYPVSTFSLHLSTPLTAKIGSGYLLIIFFLQFDFFSCFWTQSVTENCFEVLTYSISTGKLQNILQVQSTLHNSNLQGKSKNVRVIGSSKKIAGSKEKNSFYYTMNILITFNCRNVK